MLDDPAPSHTPDLLAHDRGAFSGRRDARQFPKVRASNNHARGNLARSTKHIGDGNIQIGKRIVSRGDVPQRSALASGRRQSGSDRVVIHELVGQNVTGSSEVTTVKG